MRPLFFFKQATHKIKQIRNNKSTGCTSKSNNSSTNSSMPARRTQKRFEYEANFVNNVSDLEVTESQTNISKFVLNTDTSTATNREKTRQLVTYN